MSIGWTFHAVERINERFPDRLEIRIPNRRIERISAKVSTGEQFRTRSGPAVLVCKKIAENKVIVVTVLFAERIR